LGYRYIIVLLHVCLSCVGRGLALSQSHILKCVRVHNFIINTELVQAMRRICDGYRIRHHTFGKNKYGICKFMFTLVFGHLMEPAINEPQFCFNKRSYVTDHITNTNLEWPKNGFIFKQSAKKFRTFFLNLFGSDRYTRTTVP
jgi:hypothetical protein